MNVEWVRTHCLSFPHATEQVQWGNDLVFKIGGKMFAVTPLADAPTAKADSSVLLSFKCTPEDFAELIERPGVIPAPYLARAKWVGLESMDALPRADIKRFLRQSYDLVFATLTRKLQTELAKPAKRK